MYSLSVFDWVFFLVYLIVVFGLGVFFARGQQDNEDYFVGGRKMNWMAVGISLFATGFSSLSFVALPREAAYEDYHFLITILFIPLVITPILWWLFVPLFIRLRITSVYEYLEIRFSRSVRRIGTVLFSFYAIGWMGSMLYAVGLILQAVLGLNDVQLAWTLVGVGMFAVIYTMLGGVEAVVWTDVLQAITLSCGMVVVLWLALKQIDGGWSTVVQLGVENGKFHMFNFDLDPTQRRTFLTACAFGLFMYLPGYTASQVTVQRYLCMSSLREARLALLMNAVVVTLVAVLFLLVGSTLFAFYHQAGAGGFPELAREDQILPHFVATELHQAGLVGLLMAGLFAAAMSTLDSGLNSLTAVVVYDWLGGKNLPVMASRMLCCIFGVGIIGAALLVPLIGEHVIGIIMIFAGTFLGLLLGVFLLGMLVPRANSKGVLIGLSWGVLCLVVVWTLTNTPHWWYGAFTCFPTFGVGWLASFFFPPPTNKQLQGLVWKKYLTGSE